jgi:hypothetical protein
MVTWLAAAALFRWVEEPAHRLLLHGPGAVGIPARAPVMSDTAVAPAVSERQSQSLSNAALADAILPVPLSEESP